MIELMAFMGTLSLLTQQISEQLFGPYIHGNKMRLVAIGVGAGLAYGLSVLEIKDVPINNFTIDKVLVVGAFSGVWSNGVHALFERYIPSVNAGHISVGVVNATRRALNTNPMKPPTP